MNIAPSKKLQLDLTNAQSDAIVEALKAHALTLKDRTEKNRVDGVRRLFETKLNRARAGKTLNNGVGVE